MCRAYQHHFKTTSPQGDGNILRQKRNEVFHDDFKTTSPQGDGNFWFSLQFAHPQRTILKPHPRKGTETHHYSRKDCVMSNTVTIRLSDEERKMLDVVAQAHDCKVPSLMKRFALEKVEDEYDISIFEKYEKQDAEGRMKTRPIDAFFAECGL